MKHNSSRIRTRSAALATLILSTVTIHAAPVVLSASGTKYTWAYTTGVIGSGIQFPVSPADLLAPIGYEIVLQDAWQDGPPLHTGETHISDVDAFMVTQPENGAGYGGIFYKTSSGQVWDYWTRGFYGWALLRPDVDGDGLLNGVDPDDDNDGVLDGSDAFPYDPAEWLDTDNDGTGNNADPDDDGDGEPDVTDIFPLDPLYTTYRYQNLDTNGTKYTWAYTTGVPGSGIQFPIDPASLTAPTDYRIVLQDEWQYGPPLLTGLKQIDDVDAYMVTLPQNGAGYGGIFYKTSGGQVWDYWARGFRAWAVFADADSDGVGDDTDAFPGDPTETVDTDEDGIGNNADTDDDGDGYGDTLEAILGTDPLVVTTEADIASVKAAAEALARTAGQNDVTGNPSAYSLFTAAEVAAAEALARTAGQNDVTNDPGSYSLFTENQFQALSPGAMIGKGANGKFVLTLDVLKSIDLQTFSHMNVSGETLRTNANGDIELEFSSADDAAFFRLEPR